MRRHSHLLPSILAGAMFLAGCPEDSTTDGDGGTMLAVNTDLFLEGALAEDITTEDCTLSGGEVTSCYSITVTGTPASHNVGPFCPKTINDTAEDGGLWIDDGKVYDIDGEFILNLPVFYDDEDWVLYDEDGNVRVIDNAEAFENAARPNVDEEYWYHCVEGQMAWLNDEETINATVLIPTTPVAGETATGPAEDHGNLGVTLDGVLLSGTAALDAILAAYTLAAFDDCGGHINPALGYHIHGAHNCSEVGDAPEAGETKMFGYAIDGYPIHSPYGEADAADVDLDECNGHTSDSLGYHYHAYGLENNAILTCVKGQYVENAGGGPGGGGPGGGGMMGPP